MVERGFPVITDPSQRGLLPTCGDTPKAIHCVDWLAECNGHSQEVRCRPIRDDYIFDLYNDGLTSFPVLFNIGSDRRLR
jgi:hypothetical protein